LPLWMATATEEPWEGLKLIRRSSGALSQEVPSQAVWLLERFSFTTYGVDSLRGR
jgi:hypothetical protein